VLYENEYDKTPNASVGVNHVENISNFFFLCRSGDYHY
jgi:hypothetical protein